MVCLVRQTIHFLLSFKCAVIDESSEDRLEVLCYIHKAEVGRMGAVDGAGVLEGASEDAFAINKVNIFITAVDCVMIRVDYNSSSTY